MYKQTRFYVYLSHDYVIMTKHQSRVSEVMNFFDHGDTNLAFRRLLDCAMDTQNMSIYKECITLTDWKESHPNHTEELIIRAKEILAKIAQVPVQENVIDTPVLQAEKITNLRESKIFFGTHLFENKKR